MFFTVTPCQSVLKLCSEHWNKDGSWKSGNFGSMWLWSNPPVQQGFWGLTTIICMVGSHVWLTKAFVSDMERIEGNRAWIEWHILLWFSLSPFFFHDTPISVFLSSLLTTPIPVFYSFPTTSPNSYLHLLFFSHDPYLLLLSFPWHHSYITMPHSSYDVIMTSSMYH